MSPMQRTSRSSGAAAVAAHAALATVHQDAPALIDADVTTHAALDSGVHGAGGNTLITDAQAEHSPMFYRLLSKYHFSFPLRITSAHTLTADRLYAVPFLAAKAYTVTQLGLYVSTGAAGAARLGIYVDNGSIYPGTLLSDAGVIDVTNIGFQELIGLSISLTANTLYWLVYLSDAGPAIYCSSSEGGWQILGDSTASINNLEGHYSQAEAYGALPDPHPAGSTGDNDNNPAIGVLLT